ncbi:MAG: hypothetical protein AB8B89_07215 [Gammaproteobacteria bacterium]
MPFSYELTLGDSIPSNEKYIFKCWIEDAWDNYHNHAVAFAILEGPKGLGKVFTNGACQLLEHAKLQQGSMITATTIMGVVAADGESIPYGKPYAVFNYDL